VLDSEPVALLILAGSLDLVGIRVRQRRGGRASASPSLGRRCPRCEHPRSSSRSSWRSRVGSPGVREGGSAALAVGGRFEGLLGVEGDSGGAEPRVAVTDALVAIAEDDLAADFIEREHDEG
jgi:hypothetical protein